MTLTFSEANLLSSLSGMEDRAMVAFAAACATRQLSCYEAYAAKFATPCAQEMGKYVAQVWEAIEHAGASDIDWQQSLESIMNLAPGESDSWTPLHAYADDAIASLAYSVRCLIKKDAQEAAWAARRAYESVDQAAIKALNPELNGPESEARIRSHPVVQRELQRQLRDLQLLRGEEMPSGIQHVRSMAYQERVLEESEMLVG